MNMIKIETPRSPAHPASSAATDKSEGKQGNVRVRVSDLLAGSRQAILEHNGQDYQLRITSNGKLILTK